MNSILLGLTVTLLPAGGAAAQDAVVPGTPLALAARDKVQKELKLSAEQVRTARELVEEVRKGKEKAADVQARLDKALKPAQRERLRQISYQVRGGAALRESEVAAGLGLTKKQRADIAEIQSDADRQLPMFLQVARFRNAAAKATYIRNHYKQAAQKMLAVLTDEQKKQYTKMQGKAFDVRGLDRP
jgi:hypothetical protein